MDRSRRRRVGPLAALLLAGAGLVGACTDDGSALPAPDATSVGTPTVPRTPRPPPTSSPSARPVVTPSPAPLVAAFDADRALGVATELVAVSGPRAAGSQAEATARAWVTARLRDAGWQVTEQRVPLPQGGTSANVIAHRGPFPVGAPHVVVGAHLDTVAGSPGGNDNASGIGVLVAVAEELADEDLGLPVVLVAFGAEEYQPSQPRQHHLGSAVYAERASPHVVAALSVDMVGVGDRTCVCWFDAGPPTLAQRLEAVAADHAIGPVSVEARGDISDHGPFARRGVPAAFLWTGTEPRWHSPRDTGEQLRVEDLRRAGDLVLAFLRSLEGDEADGLRDR